MNESALKRSDRSVFTRSFNCWSVRLLVLAFLIVNVHWISGIEAARAAETTYTSPASSAESVMAQDGRSESPRSSVERFEELNRKYGEQKQELTELREEYERLRVSRRVRWYLFGAAVFLVGWIIGFSARRKPKRYSLET